MKKRDANFIIGFLVNLIGFLIYWFTGYNKFGHYDPRNFSELIDFVCDKPLHLPLILLVGAVLASYLKIFPIGKD